MQTLTLREKPHLFGRVWPVEAPRGAICIVHGLGEHSERYAPLADALNAAGFAVTALDLRGHGRTESKRGHIARYGDALGDIAQLLAYAESAFAHAPLFLYGHSLGGNLVLNYLLRRNVDDLAGAIVSSPWLRLSFEPPAYKIALARTLGRLLPGFLQPSGLNPDHLSHDPAVVQAYRNDPLVHDRISAALFLNIHEAGLWALENAKKLHTPLLLMHGAADPITSPDASREFCARAGDFCTLKLWEGMYHEVHNEIGKEAVYRTVVDWLQAHV